jgi:hypothetical protein
LQRTSIWQLVSFSWERIKTCHPLTLVLNLTSFKWDQIFLSFFFLFLLFCFLAVLRIAPRTSCLLGKCFTTWAMSPAQDNFFGTYALNKIKYDIQQLSICLLF